MNWRCAAANRECYIIEKYCHNYILYIELLVLVSQQQQIKYRSIYCILNPNVCIYYEEGRRRRFKFSSPHLVVYSLLFFRFPNILGH